LGGYALGFVGHKLKLPPYGYASAVRGWFGDAPEVRPAEDGKPREGKFYRDRRDSEGGGDLEEETKERLAAIGYLSGYEPATNLNNVTVYVPEMAYEGLNLYNSGHAPEAFLMDMSGNVLHRWSYDFSDAFPDEPVAKSGKHSSQWWRRVHLFEDGGLLAIYEGRGLVRLDRDSNLLWGIPGGYHHEVWVDADGTIYALYRESKKIPRIHETQPVTEDYIAILDPDGNVQKKVSLLEAFENTPYASLLLGMPEHGDIFHSNSLDILDGSHPAEIFGAGRALISLRNIHTVAVVDLEQEQVVWALAGMFSHQHEPWLLPNGNMMLFDNTGHNGRSKVVEFEPLTQQIEWAYLGTEENDFFSATLGACQRLPNGNTLITESEAGRAFEITHDQKIVWEFYNPAQAGDDGEFIATLFEVVRLPPDFEPDWIESTTVANR
jgi:hypothetical protein